MDKTKKQGIINNYPSSADIAHGIGSSYVNINARDFYKLSPDRQEPGLSFEF